MAATTNRKASSSIADLQAKMFAGKNDRDADKDKSLQAGGSIASRRTRSFNPAILAFSQQLEGNPSPASKPEKKKDNARPAPGKLKKFSTVSTSIGGAEKAANLLAPPGAGATVGAPSKGKRKISSKLSALFGSGGSASPFGGSAPGGGPARAVKSGNLMSPSVDFASVRHKRSQTVANRAISSKLEGLLGAGPPIMIRPGGRPRPKSSPSSARNDGAAASPLSISVTGAPDGDNKDGSASGDKPDRQHLRSQSMMIHANLQRPRVSRHRRSRSRTRFKPKKTFISEELGVDVPKPAPDVKPTKPQKAATKVPKSPYDTKPEAAATKVPKSPYDTTKPQESKAAATKVPKSPYDTASNDAASTQNPSEAAPTQQPSDADADAAATVMSDVVDAVVNNVEADAKGSEKKDSGEGKEDTEKEQAPSKKENKAEATNELDKAVEENGTTKEEKEKEESREKRDSNAMDTSSDSAPVADSEAKIDGGSGKTLVSDTSLEKSKNEAPSPKTETKSPDKEACSGKDETSLDSASPSKADKSAKSSPAPSVSAYPRPKPKPEVASYSERPAAAQIDQVKNQSADVPAPVAMDTSPDGAPDDATQLTPQKRKTSDVLETTSGKRGSRVNGTSLPTQVEQKPAENKTSSVDSCEKKPSEKLEAAEQPKTKPVSPGMAAPALSLQDIQKPLKSTKKTQNDTPESDVAAQKEKYKTSPAPLGLAANGAALADLKKSLRSRGFAIRPKSKDFSEEPGRGRSKTVAVSLGSAAQAPALHDLKKGLKKTSHSGKTTTDKKPESVASRDHAKSIESSAPLTVAQIIAARNKAKKG